MTAPEITPLDERTVERIAAGEVVERPASAVKELLENSIDADANRVRVAIESGGRGGIRVTDDGTGMSEQAVEQAVREHTTSKISDISDLDGGVGTLGFRGEALHAIGAVSRLTITTRPRGGDRGTELTVEGGDVVDISPAGCPEGTTVEVADLFYNVPARRKYLKQDATEFAHINTVVTNYALANPEVAIALEHNGRETFATNGTGSLREAVLSVYGREVAESMIDLDTAAVPAGPLDGVSGLVSHPETNRASREYLSTFVNGRYVKANAVREAVVDAYGGQLAGDRYPFVVLDLAVDPGTVDVNVHPRKMEVRFTDEEGVRDQIETAVEETLLGEGLIRSRAPRGRSAAEQTEIRPESSPTGEDADSEEGPGSIDDSSGSIDDSSEPATDSSGSTANSSGSTTDSDEAGEDSRSRSLRIESDQIADRTESEQPTAGSEPTGRSHPDSGDGRKRPESSGSERDANSAPERSAERKFEDAGEQARLTGEDGRQRAFDSLPAMRILGQFDETYVVAETRDGLVLIDQHAADERVNYERLRDSLAAETTTQALATPVRLELTAREAELFAAHEDALASLGFQASAVDDRTVEVTTVPSLVEAADPELLCEVLGEFVSDAGTAGETVEAVADELLADLACYPSVTGNTSLTEGSIVELLAALDDCENPYACPHGRPVIVEFDTEEIESRFERDYPGHQH